MYRPELSFYVKEISVSGSAMEQFFRFITRKVGINYRTLDKIELERDLQTGYMGNVEDIRKADGALNNLSFELKNYENIFGRY